MTAPRVLVVDDDPKVLSLMRRGLSHAGYDVDLAADGEQALVIANSHGPDVVILDLMLPGIDGFEVCRRLRRLAGGPPILILTARDRVPDRIAGLDAGADDYLVKPFAFDELLARIRALLRRARPTATQEVRLADLTIDLTARRVDRSGRVVELTAREYDLLELLARSPRQIFSREQIFERVWGSDFLGESNLIDVNIKRLRDKLEARGEPRLIQTVRGVGYTLNDVEA